MRFYNMMSMIKTTTKAFFSLNNKQFTMLENKPFIFGALLLKHPRFDKKLIMFVNKLLVKTFNNSINNKPIGILHKGLIDFFDKTTLNDLLRLREDVDTYTEKSLIDERG